MSYEQRRPVFNLSGSLSAGCGALDTQISSTVFTSLPTDFSSGSYLPVVIANDTQGKAEIVWIIGHAASSPTVTVVRGMEGTTAQTFNQGDVVRCAPTTRDVLPVYASFAALPADAHNGMRAVTQDTGTVWEKTAAGWGAEDMAALRATLFGGPTRTRPQICEVKYAGSQGPVAANTNTVVSGNWTAVVDTDSLYNGTGSIYMQAAVSGRYFTWGNISWDVNTPAGGVSTVAYLVKNSVVAPPSSAAVVSAMAQTPSGAAAPNKWGEDIILAAGDKLYLQLWSNVANNVRGSALPIWGTYSHFGMRYVGPV